MTSNYAPIIARNLETLFQDDLSERARSLAADIRTEAGATALIMPAFGRQCRYTRQAVFLDDQAETGPRGIILSLYALHAVEEELQLEPFKSFKELPNSMPYQGAFRNRTELSLVPVVDRIGQRCDAIRARIDGLQPGNKPPGDFSLVVRPLPKIALCYLFYAADDDFPAAVTCLYSNNADHFMPTDGLADVGEFTSEAILELIANGI